MLKVVPTRSWSPEALTQVNFSTLPSVSGHLDVNFKDSSIQKGAFKTAHPGSISLSSSNNTFPPSLSGNVCIKQHYFLGTAGRIKRYSPLEEQSYIHSEVACLDWAKILLDLTYQFIRHTEDEKGGFPGTIPKLQFVEAAVAGVSGGTKFVLVEEWIDTSKEPFMKYINNARAVSCISPRAPQEIQNIANFLCFAQHVQYQVTKGTLFTSDYQGIF